MLIAYAQVMPKIFIFDFMDASGVHIGPCWTHPDFRGRGLYPWLLTKILRDYQDRASNVYVFTSGGNHASKRGIEKAGGRLFAKGVKDAHGIYRVTEYISQ